MTSVGEARLLHVQVPHFDRMVHRTGQQKVAGVVERNFPHGLAVLRPSVGTACINEVPNFDCSVAGGGREQVSSGVEGAAANPILVALAAHDEVSIGNAPEFPGGVVTSSGHDVFLGVVAESSDTLQVAFIRLQVAKMGTRSLKRFVQGRVKSFALRDHVGFVCHF